MCIDCCSVSMYTFPINHTAVSRRSTGLLQRCQVQNIKRPTTTSPNTTTNVKRLQQQRRRQPLLLANSQHRTDTTSVTFTPYYRICKTAIQYGRLSSLKHLQDKHLHHLDRQDDRYARIAARFGQLECLVWLCRQGFSCHCSSVCTVAAENGHVEVLQWLRAALDPPCPWNVTTCAAYAARNGHIRMLEWIRVQDSTARKWTAGVTAEAADFGQLQVLQWLRALDPPCPWNEGVCNAAAENGHLPVLQWVRAQHPPCPWGERTCHFATIQGHLEVLQWIVANGCPIDWHYCKWLAREKAALSQWIEDNEPVSYVS